MEWMMIHCDHTEYCVVSLRDGTAGPVLDYLTHGKFFQITAKKLFGRHENPPCWECAVTILYYYKLSFLSNKKPPSWRFFHLTSPAIGSSGSPSNLKNSNVSLFQFYLIKDSVISYSPSPYILFTFNLFYISLVRVF